MTWECGCYYHPRKVRGKVVRDYYGTGPGAVLMAQLHALQRAEREAERAVRRTERAELDALDAPLGKLNEAADQLARAVLLAAGYRQHNRGEWRKRYGR
jgi:hypothetical protein